MNSQHIPKNEEEWRQRLTPEQYRILREGGTELPFTSAVVSEHTKGMYLCTACGNELFSSSDKFDSGSGWPSFTEPANSENIQLASDGSHGIERTEVRCSRCGSHLGHVFDDGPRDKGGKRYCINSICLQLDPKDLEPQQTTT